MKTIHAQSGHTMYIGKVEPEDMPDFEYTKDSYTKFYVVRNWDKGGVIFMYLAKGHPVAPKQVVAWYRGGQFWPGFGSTLKEAIDGAQKDGWMHTGPAQQSTLENQA